MVRFDELDILTDYIADLSQKLNEGVNNNENTSELFDCAVALEGTADLIKEILVENLPEEDRKMTQIYQVECNDKLNINEWLRDNPDIEVVDIQASLNEIGELITVVYKIDMEDN